MNGQTNQPSQDTTQALPIKKLSLISLFIPFIGVAIGALISFFVNIFVGILFTGILMIVLILIFRKRYGYFKKYRSIVTVIYILASFACISFFIFIFIFLRPNLGYWFNTLDGGKKCTSSDQCRGECIGSISSFYSGKNFECSTYYIRGNDLTDTAEEVKKAFGEDFFTKDLNINLGL